MALRSQDLPPVDLYSLLGINRTASQSDIVKAYRVLALKCHPDRNANNPKMTEIFRLATLAYDVLSDPKKRHAYDKMTKPSLFARILPWAGSHKEIHAAA